MHCCSLHQCIGKDPLYATSQQLYTEHADIAQQVERILGKDEVPGSNPGISSRSSPLRVFRRGDFLYVFKGSGFLHFQHLVVRAINDQLIFSRLISFSANHSSVPYRIVYALIAYAFLSANDFS